MNVKASVVMPLLNVMLAIVSHNMLALVLGARTGWKLHCFVCQAQVKLCLIIQYCQILSRGGKSMLPNRTRERHIVCFQTSLPVLDRSKNPMEQFEFQILCLRMVKEAGGRNTFEDKLKLIIIFSVSYPPSLGLMSRQYIQHLSLTHLFLFHRHHCCSLFALCLTSSPVLQKQPGKKNPKYSNYTPFKPYTLPSK